MRKISIMIPTFDQAAYIEKCVQSAQMQDYGNLEIVISDDSRDDSIKNIFETHFASDERVRYFRNANRLGRVGNYHDTLYEKANGDYVLNLDGDDWLTDSSYISKACKILENHPEVVCVLGRIQYLDEREAKIIDGDSYDNFPEIMDGFEYLSLSAQKQVPFNHLSALYRRHEAKELNFYTVDTVWTDSESLFRLIYTGKVALINEFAGVWRIHEENESRSFYRGVKVEELFLSEQSVADFCSPTAKSKGFDVDAWLDLWKYDHVKEFIVFSLKDGKIKRILELLNFLIRKHARFLMRKTPNLLFDISLRVSAYIKRAWATR